MTDKARMEEVVKACAQAHAKAPIHRLAQAGRLIDKKCLMAHRFFNFFKTLITHITDGKVLYKHIWPSFLN